MNIHHAYDASVVTQVLLSPVALNATVLVISSLPLILCSTLSYTTFPSVITALLTESDASLSVITTATSSTRFVVGSTEGFVALTNTEP